MAKKKNKLRDVLAACTPRQMLASDTKQLVLNAYQLLPGEACPAYAYRYRFLGRVSIDPHKCHTWTEELLARLGETKKRQTESIVIWRSKRVRHTKAR